MLKSPLFKIIVALVLVVVIVFWLMRPRPIPPAVEANRIWHPDGYSFISPPDWKMSLETERATLTKYNRGWLRADPVGWHYYPPSLVLNCLREAPDADDLKSHEQFVDGTFQNLPALIWFGRKKKYYIYRVIFQDRDRWFEFILSTPDFYDVPHSGWWAYLQSYRYEPERAAQLKTESATMPVFHFTTTFPVN